MTGAIFIHYSWPRQKTFALQEHGGRAANELSREWCRKANYFFELWLWDEGDEDFRYHDLSYTETEKFLDWAVTVNTETETWDRLSELRHTWLSNPS